MADTVTYPTADSMPGSMPKKATVRFCGKKAPWWYATGAVFFATTVWLAILSALYCMDGLTANAVVALCGVITLLAFDAFFVDSCIRNQVDLQENSLKVRVSFFSLEVPYSEIRLIEETNNPLASLATSLDRIRIRFCQYDEVFIAVMNKEEFFTTLQTRCPKARLVRKAHLRK